MIIATYSEELSNDLASIPEEYRERYKAGYIKRFVAYLSSRTRIASAMIVGPANFPTERMRKRNDVAHNREGEFYQFREHSLEAIKRLERRKGKIAAIEATGVVATDEVFGDIILRHNRPIDRIQVIFDGKPSPQVIQLMKSRAFKWSPTQKAWQRQLTVNGITAAKQVINKIIQEL
jgi:hypothetical protein